ncbi:MAG: polysaccharide pyruvyl transferase family protein [Idiomarina sp.]|nr:polysaccharide pyruvyl transferase family protein [Idiomarina sp.]
MKRFSVAIFNDTSPSLHFGCDLVMHQIRHFVEGIGGEIIWTWPVAEDWREYRATIAARQKPDLVIVNGEGSIHHSESRPRAQFLPMLSTFTREQWGVPVVLLNSTLYALRNQEIELIQKFNLCSVRDSQSQSYIKSGHFTPVVTGDLTLTTDWHSDTNFERYIPGLVTDSVIGDVKRSLLETAKRLNLRYMNLTHKGLLPNQIRSETNDLVDFQQLFDSNPGFSMLAYLARIQRVVTGRYHCVTLCLLARTPFVAVESNTPKISRLLTEVFGNSDRCISPENLDTLRLEDIPPFTEREVTQIDSYIEELTATTQDFFGQVRRLTSN